MKICKTNNALLFREHTCYARKRIYHKPEGPNVMSVTFDPLLAFVLLIFPSICMEFNYSNFTVFVLQNEQNNTHAKQ